MPIRCGCCAMRSEKARAGAANSGAEMGSCRDLQVLTDAQVTILSERRKNPPYGLSGGEIGSVWREHPDTGRKGNPPAGQGDGGVESRGCAQHPHTGRGRLREQISGLKLPEHFAILLRVGGIHHQDLVHHFDHRLRISGGHQRVADRVQLGNGIGRAPGFAVHFRQDLFE